MWRRSMSKHNRHLQDFLREQSEHKHGCPVFWLRKKETSVFNPTRVVCSITVHTTPPTRSWTLSQVDELCMGGSRKKTFHQTLCTRKAGMEPSPCLEKHSSFASLMCKTHSKAS